MERCDAAVESFRIRRIISPRIGITLAISCIIVLENGRNGVQDNSLTMKEIYLLLGSNRGDREAIISQAVEMVGTIAGKVLRSSHLYSTDPWGFEDATPFLNLALEIESDLDPDHLMEQLLVIETRLGRIRPFDGCGCGIGHAEKIGDPPAYESRTIDIDILFVSNRLVFTNRLMVPHPRMHERRFALVPMCELAPGFVHPLLKKNMTTLLRECNDQAGVTVIEK